MDYMTLKEASEKWGVSSRQINYYCTDGRIPGAVKMAGVWLIPKEAENSNADRIFGTVFIQYLFLQRTTVSCFCK